LLKIDNKYPAAIDSFWLDFSSTNQNQVFIGILVNCYYVVTAMYVLFSICIQ